MQANVGGLDRIVRIVLGLGVIAAGVVFKSRWGLVGIVPLATAAVGVCPAYLPFGISTCKKPAPRA
jgi:hypothetical protein